MARRLTANLAPRGQRGAILILTAAFIIAAVALLALAVDTGRLYATQTKLQSAANLAALDAARAASDCRLQTGNDALAAAGASVARNYSGLSQGMPAVTRLERGQVKPDPDTHLQAFTPASALDTAPNAVRLTLTDSTYRPLFALFGDDTLTLNASAGAASLPQARLLFGTTLANENPRLLSALLGPDIGTNIDVASLNSLAETRVTLAQLLDLDAGIATPDDVARLSVNDALANVSDLVNPASRQVLGALSSALGNQKLAEIMNLTGPIGSGALVSLGGLVNAAAQLVAADRQAPIDLPINAANLPAGLGGLKAKLLILEPPNSNFGAAGIDSAGNYYTVVHSAKASLTLTLDLNVDLGLADVAKVTLPISVQFGQGEARLQRIDCPTLNDPSFRVRVEGETAPASAAIGRLNPNGSIRTGDPAEVTVAGESVARVSNNGNALSTVPTASGFQADFGPITNFDDLPLTYTGDERLNTDSLASLLGNINLKIELLRSDGKGGVVGGLLGGIGNVLNGLTNAILQSALEGITGTLQNLAEAPLGPLLDPALGQLGISLARPTLTLDELVAAQPTLFCSAAEDCGFEPADGS